MALSELSEILACACRDAVCVKTSCHKTLSTDSSSRTAVAGHVQGFRDWVNVWLLLLVVG